MTRLLTVPTGFRTLDKLLGGRGFTAGSTVLIKGEPGTGKSTLALQIAHYAVKENGHTVIFVLFEEPGYQALDQISRTYWSKSLEDYFGHGHSERLNVVDGLRALEQIGSETAGEWWKRWTAEYYTKESHLAPQAADKRARQEWDAMADAEKVRLIEECLKDLSPLIVFDSLWANLLKKRNLKPPLMIVIDSLHGLIHAAHTMFVRTDARQILALALRSFKGWWHDKGQRGTVIFTGEAEGGSLDAAESYIADTVIELRREVRERRLREVADRSASWSDDLMFCSVRKGRWMPIERRSCCYEFVQLPGEEGIKFYPSYAAQGLCSLFHENQPQREVIATLRDVDGPSLYPGLIVQEFTRSALQKASAIRRYAEKIPRRHPLLIANVDEYWVSDLRRRDLLHAIPIDELRLYSAPASAAERSRIISEIDDKSAADGGYLCRSDNREFYYAIPQFGNVGLMVYRRDLLAELSRVTDSLTWEGLVDATRELETRRKPFLLLLETQTYDTLFTTVLELGWSNGAFWHTEPKNKDLAAEDGNLRVVFTEGTLDDFVFAVEQLFHWVHVLRIVPPRSTVDPEMHPQADWAFARHWYSTWVDVCTRKDAAGRFAAEIAADADRCGVLRLPVFERYANRCRDNGSTAQHTSCWGEWYLAIQKGSENTELGVEIINNLMTSRKVTDRALSGAGLPLQEQFYIDCGDAMCFATDQTFNALREMFFRNARSRTKFFGFRTVARVLSGKLQAVVNNPKADVERLVRDAFRTLDPDFPV